jgi:hypothetical protein
MKVKIGKYKNWIGPYQIAEKILFWMDKHEDHRVHEFGRWLSENKHGEDSLLTKVCQWIHNKQKRTVKIKLDPWDDWSADHTMALIIHPLLVQLKNSKMRMFLNICGQRLRQQKRTNGTPTRIGSSVGNGFWMK